MADGHVRVLGVQVDGRDVDREGILQPRDPEARDAVGGGAAATEFQGDPGRVLVRRQGERGLPGLEVRPARGPVHPHGELQFGHRMAAVGRGQLRPGQPPQIVVGPGHGELQARAAGGLARPRPRRRRRELGERALGAPQVGHAHGREHPARIGVRREGDGHPQDGAGHPVLGQGPPEGLAAPQQLVLGLGPPDHPRPQLAQPARLGDARGRQHRQVGARVPREEVEDVVAAGVGPGREGGPAHRRHGRQGGGQVAVAARVGQPLQVRHEAPSHKLFAQMGIDAIQPHHDHPPRPGLARPSAAAPGAQGHAQRPQEHRADGQQDPCQGEQERAAQGKAGAGPDVGQGRARRARQDGGGHHGQDEVRRRKRATAQHGVVTRRERDGRRRRAAAPGAAVRPRIAPLR